MVHVSLKPDDGLVRPAADWGPADKLAKRHFQQPTIDRLVDRGRIGGEEMQALIEIDYVYSHLGIGFIPRGLNMDRVDGSWSKEPLRFVNAYWKHYRPWADALSVRRKQRNDVTLEVVFDVLFSDVTGKELDARFGWRKGRGLQVFISGLRLYAIEADWADNKLRPQWQAEAEALFPRRLSA